MRLTLIAALLALCLLTGCSKTEVNSVYVEPDSLDESLPQGDAAASDLTESSAPEAVSEDSSYDIAAEHTALARDHLEQRPYSENALILVLQTDDLLTEEEAAAAVKSCGADWNEQSRLTAVALLEKEFLSRGALKLRLKSQGFTESQAEYGADNSGLDEIEQALSKAKSYLEFSSFSYDGLVKQLMNEGFTERQARSAANSCGADWYEQAVLSAKKYADFRDFTREELIEQLLDDGFTPDQAEMAIEKNRQRR